MSKPTPSSSTRWIAVLAGSFQEFQAFAREKRALRLWSRNDRHRFDVTADTVWVYVYEEQHAISGEWDGWLSIGTAHERQQHQSLCDLLHALGTMRSRQRSAPEVDASRLPFDEWLRVTAARMEPK